MRFCLVSTQENWGGGEALLASVGQELLLSGHQVCWIVRADSDVLKKTEETAGTVLHATRKRGSNLRDWFGIRRALRDWNPDVVILNDTHAVPLVGSAAMFCRSPRPLRLAYKHTIFPLRSPLKYRLLCDQVVCVSEAALATVTKGGLQPRHAVVVRGGCTPVEPDSKARASVRHEFAVQADQTLLVSIGSLLECKGHRELVDAIALQDSPTKTVVLIAGEGDERENLERLIESRGLGPRVRLLGYRDDAQRLLDAADLVVHPSHAEGLSLVLIQSQMLRKPIVATAVGGAREVLATGSEACSAWIAQAQNAADLAAKISQATAAISQPSPELQEKLHKTAKRMLRDFTVKASAANLAELAASLIASGSARLAQG